MILTVSPALPVVKNYKLLIFTANPDFKLAALFLWIIPFLTNLSIKEVTLGSFPSAVGLSEINLMSFNALRIVFAK